MEQNKLIIAAVEALLKEIQDAREQERWALQCCYNYIQTQRDSDEKRALMEMCETLGCIK